MKIILTKHVIERRKKGNIPKNKLIHVAKTLIENNKEKIIENGSYKFFKGGTTAIIEKKENKYIFITFFGRTGYVIDTNEYGSFNCIFQSEEYLIEKQKRKDLRKMFKNKSKKIKREDLRNLSSYFKNKLEKSYEIRKINENIIRQGSYLFFSKSDPIVEVLKKMVLD